MQWGVSECNEAFDQTCDLLLLLLLLLGAGTETRKYGAGLDDDAGSCFFWRRRAIRRTYRYCNTQLALRVALVDAAGGWDVSVIAANGDTNVAIASDQIIRRVKSDPAHARHQSLDPRM